MAVEINYVAVVAAALANMVLGMLWYGPLFGKPWMKLMGWKEADFEKMKNDPKMKGKMPMLYLAALAGALVMAYVLAHVITYVGAHDAASGAQAGFWMWLGFIATVMLGSVLWENKPVNLYLLNVGYYLVALVLMGAVIAIM